MRQALNQWPIVFCLCFGLIGSARSAEAVSSFGKEEPVTLDDFRPHLEDTEGYTEEWSQNVYLPDGTFLALDFGLSNLALTSDHNGMFRAEVRLPDGKEVSCGQDLSEDEWSSSPEGFHLRFGKAELSGGLDGLHAQAKCERLSLDLQFVNQGPPLKPGGGILHFGEGGGLYRITFTSPRAKVTGSFLLDGKTFKVEGVGHAMHTHYNLRPDEQVHRWFRFRNVDQEVTVIMAELEAVPRFAGATRGWVLVLDQQGRLVSTGKVNFTYDGFIRDAKEKDGYEVPRRIRVAAVDGNASLTGELLMKGINKVTDPTADLGAIKRAIVRRYIKPRDYHVSCSFKLRIKNPQDDRTIQGDGVFHYYYVNP
jgi:hypothetical protein